MTLEQYIQIAILVILAFLLWRDNRIEKRREAAKDRNLASSFNNLKDCLDAGIKAALSSLKAQIELTYSERYAAITSMLIDLRNGISALPSEEFIEKSISSILSTSSLASLPSILTELQSLQTPIKLWGEAQANNIIKEGEANRTLRKKLQDKREILSQMNANLSNLSSQLKATRTELNQVKSEAANFMAALVSELDFTRSWLDAKGMPLSALDKQLNLEFKSSVPSREYHKALDQKELQKSLAQDAHA